jgi:subtilisin family serine protease
VLQGVPDAWCFLEQTLGSSSKHGSANVCIATVDSGINEGHPDATAGLLKYINLCEDCGDIPEDPHGMAVYGIVSATPDNGTGTSGIASGARHTAIGMKSQWTDSAQYAEMLLWLGGVESPVTFSQPPLARPADIISCSHGIADLPTANPIADAFERLTHEGRKRPGGAALGTVLVYSSGNESSDISGTQALAANPNVIAVGDTLAPDASGVERRWLRSNYGDRLDLCAQGEDAPSLLANPLQNGSCTPSAPGPGAFAFAGTSAACPMVAATAALILTVKKDLAWGDVRDLLRQTARCIDPDGGAWQDKRSYWYGSGRLDVHEAVKAAHQISG